MGHDQQNTRNRVVYFVINIIADVPDPYAHYIGYENGRNGHKYDKIIFDDGIVKVSDFSNKYKIEKEKGHAHNPQI